MRFNLCNDNNNNFLCCSVISGSGCDSVIQDPLIRSRELFISNSTDTYPVRSLR